MRWGILVFSSHARYWLENSMGKTIQVIALLVSGDQKPNLVVAWVYLHYHSRAWGFMAFSPTVAIMQWRNEIAAHTDGLKVLVWHGASRGSDAKEMEKYDVVYVTASAWAFHKSHCTTRFLQHMLFWKGVNPSLHHVPFVKFIPSCFRKQEKGFKRGDMYIQQKSPVHQIQWNRVIVGPSVLLLLTQPTFSNSWTRHIISRTEQLTPQKQRLNSKPIIDGVFREHLYKTVSANCTA